MLSKSSKIYVLPPKLELLRIRDRGCVATNYTIYMYMAHGIV